MKKLKNGQRVRFWDAWEFSWESGTICLQQSFADQFEVDTEDGLKLVSGVLIIEAVGEARATRAAIDLMSERIGHLSDEIDLQEKQISLALAKMLELGEQLKSKTKKSSKSYYRKKRRQRLK